MFGTVFKSIKLEIVPCVSLVIFLAFLVCETIYARVLRRSVKLRIVVTGVRGKSSVTRLITYALQKRGIKVLGKVTGSKPVLLYPNGQEIEIKRKRYPSVLEQIRVLLKTANYLNVDGLVSETMSINPEILRCEMQNILKPSIIVIARITLDHVEMLGNNIEEIRKNIVNACCNGATVVTLKGNLDESSIEILKKKKCTLIEVEPRGDTVKPIDYLEFDENISLALAACQIVGLKKEEFMENLLKAAGDIGALKIWKLKSGVIVINGFAANDPESTIKVFERSKQFLIQKGFSNLNFIGILNLRSDRVDRTLQWLKCLKEWFPFERVYVTGADSALFVKRLKNPNCLTFNAGDIIEEVSKFECGTAVFGFGNIAGVGLKLIDWWQRDGECLKSLS